MLLAAAVAAPVAVAAALLPLSGHISYANVALLMIVAVVPVAFGSRLAAVVAAVSAALAFDFFWTPPRYSLNAYHGQDLAGTVLYLVVGLVANELPVRVDLQLAERLPEPVEVAAYYVISEALANAAKHARASAAQVAVRIDDEALRVHVRDDGAGGADPAKGSGIVGLRDRVEALGGRMVLASPPGEGTSVLAEFPIVTPKAEG